MNRAFTLAAVASLTLSACASAPSTQSSSKAAEPANPIILAECALYEAAMQRVAVAEGAPKFGIVEGCPGYEHIFVPGTATLFLKTASAPIPPAATALGKMGKILFRRMIARGVPNAIATDMVADPLFAAAVESYK